MTPEQKSLIRGSFDQIWPEADAVAKLFYDRLFELDPTLRPLFHGDMTVQGRALMGLLRVAVNGLDRLEDLVPALQDLGRRHVRYGVKDEHYGTVGQALIDTLERGLGPQFTDEMRAAWLTAYTVMSSVMQAAAHEMTAAA